jgi:hypothetical protein
MGRLGQGGAGPAGAGFGSLGRADLMPPPGQYGAVSLDAGRAMPSDATGVGLPGEVRCDLGTYSVAPISQ